MNFQTDEMIAYNKRCGQLIQRQRHLARMSQDYVALVMGTTRQNIGNYEIGRTKISIGVLMIFAKTLECNVMKLIPEEK